MNPSANDVQATGQTVQQRRGIAYFEVTKLDGEWTWTLFAKNGKPVAISTGDYARRNDCTKAAKAVIELFKGASPKVFINMEAD